MDSRHWAFIGHARIVLATLSLAALTGCATWDALEFNETKAGRYPGHWYEKPQVFVGEQDFEARLAELNDYCASVARFDARKVERSRAIKNILSVVGVVAGTIVAPVLAEGSAIRAWAGVSGASVGAVSRMYDSATATGPTGLTGEVTTFSNEVIRINQEIRAVDSSASLLENVTERLGGTKSADVAAISRNIRAEVTERKVQLAQGLLLFCSLHDQRRGPPPPRRSPSTQGETTFPSSPEKDGSKASKAVG